MLKKLFKKNIRNINGIYLVIVKCNCANSSCQVDLFRMENEARSSRYILTVPSFIISDSGNIKALKISRNAYNLVIVTRNNINGTATTLQYFRLQFINNTANKIAEIQRSYFQSLSYFVMIAYQKQNRNWFNGILYATTNNGKFVLRLIDQDGTDSLFNNILDPQMTINSIRLYGSKNGKYIGILRQFNSNLNVFQMYRVQKLNKIGIQYLQRPDFIFQQIGPIFTVDINQYGNRIAYLVARQTQNQVVILNRTIHQSKHIRPCQNLQYAGMFPQFCNTHQTQPQIQTQNQNPNVAKIEQASKSQIDLLLKLTIPSFVLAASVFILIVIIAITCFVLFRKHKKSQLKKKNTTQNISNTQINEYQSYNINVN